MSLNSTENLTPRSHGQSRPFASQLRDFLPIQKHAVFHVKLVIHQLHSVPLISGDFRIKWKFKHLQAVNSDGRPLGFGRVLARKLDSHKKKTTIDTSSSLKSKEKEKETSVTTILEDQHVTDDEVDVVTTSPTCIQPVELPPEDRPVLQHVGHSNSTESSASTKSQSNSSPDLLEANNGIDYHLSSRGYTPYHPLNDFKVKFETEINAAVQISIERDTLMLLPCELKLTVMQLAIPGDPAAPQNPRLGHVEVNLAEYANVGPVTRNYLLRRSKVNALLRMTLTVSQMSGEESYHVPPLRKEEVKADIASYLTEVNIPLPMFSESVHTNDPWLASVLPQVTPPRPEPEPELDALGLGLGGLQLQIPRPDSRNSNPSSQPPKKRWHVGGSKPSSRRTSDTSTSNLTVGNGSSTPLPYGHHTLNASPQHSKSRATAKSHRAPPTPPNKHHPPQSRPKPPPQLHPTELLIEAIFNPYPSTSDSLSPFTYYVPHVDSDAHLDPRREGPQKVEHHSSDTNSHSHSNSNSGSGSNANLNSPRPMLLQHGSFSGVTGTGTEGSRTSFESGSSLRIGGGGGASEGGHSQGGAASYHGSTGTSESINGSPGKPWWRRKGTGTGSSPITPASVVKG
ncbi:hypothetical protein BU17DRAFT_63693 [Hysterangium stoloniferum]|nr:hypothetical protein BU17DRAFT_63693 [Hysterangium stoloniferum]